MSPVPVPLVAPVAEEQRWAAIVATAPTMAATMRAYLDQIAVSLRPRSVEAVDNALRSLATYLVGEPHLRRLKGMRRDHVEGYKLWLAQRPAGRGKTISARTVRHRLGMLRVFFERIIDWGWDAPKSSTGPAAASWRPPSSNGWSAGTTRPGGTPRSTCSARQLRERSPGRGSRE